MSKTTVNPYQNSKNEKIAKIEFILTKLREGCKGLVFKIFLFSDDHLYMLVFVFAILLLVAYDFLQTFVGRCFSLGDAMYIVVH